MERAAVNRKVTSSNLVGGAILKRARVLTVAIGLARLKRAGELGFTAFNPTHLKNAVSKRARGLAWLERSTDNRVVPRSNRGGLIQERHFADYVG